MTKRNKEDEATPSLFILTFLRHCITAFAQLLHTALGPSKVRCGRNMKADDLELRSDSNLEMGCRHQLPSVRVDVCMGLRACGKRYANNERPLCVT
jgi:hypothetical protein